jgi:hypothetical protein
MLFQEPAAPDGYLRLNGVRSPPGFEILQELPLHRPTSWLNSVKSPPGFEQSHEHKEKDPYAMVGVFFCAERGERRVWKGSVMVGQEVQSIVWTGLWCYTQSTPVEMAEGAHEGLKPRRVLERPSFTMVEMAEALQLHFLN